MIRVWTNLRSAFLKERKAYPVVRVTELTMANRRKKGAYSLMKTRSGEMRSIATR